MTILPLVTVVACATPSREIPEPEPPSPPAAEQIEAEQTDIEVTPASMIDWQPLNPARGDASPMAATSGVIVPSQGRRGSW